MQWTLVDKKLNHGPLTQLTRVSRVMAPLRVLAFISTNWPCKINSRLVVRKASHVFAPCFAVSNEVVSRPAVLACANPIILEVFLPVAIPFVMSSALTKIALLPPAIFI